MKRSLISLTLLVISFVFVLLLSSCDQGNERTEVVFVDKADKYAECEHNWKMKSQVLPTCISEGKITMSCTLCRKVETVTTPTCECEYNIYWKWHNNNTLPRLYFDCPLNHAHTYSVDSVYTTTRIDKSCIQRGAEIKVAEVVHKGEKYTDTHVNDYGFGYCSYNTTYELIGFNCEDGIKKTQTCTVCGDVEESFEYSHFLLNEETVYSFEELGLCAGNRVIRRVCLCGENVEDDLRIYYSACNMKIEHTNTEDGDIAYNTESKTCKDCGFSWVRESADTVPEGQSKVYYAYWIVTYKLTEDFVIVKESYDEEAHDLFGHEVEYTYNNIDDRWCHEEIATCTQCLYKHTKEILHKMEYTYEPLGETCLDGINVSGVCLGCGYTLEYVTNSHQTASIEASYDLESYGFCQGTINVEVCFCGYKRLTKSGVHWYSPRKTEKTEKSDTLVLVRKTEKCSGCGFAIETVEERTLIDGAWYKTNIITNIYLDEETTLTVKFPIHDPTGTLDRPLTEEELAALEKYFEWVKYQ